MNRTESRPFRERLLASRTILRGDIEGLFERARRSREEGGANAPSDEHILRLLAEKERILELVERALERIEDRTYGTCHQCGAPIELKRLKTLLFAHERPEARIACEAAPDLRLRRVEI